MVGVKHMSISLDLGSLWTWSGEFPLDQIGEFFLKLLKTSNEEEYFVKE